MAALIMEDFFKPKVVYMEIQTDNPNQGYPFPCFSPLADKGNKKSFAIVNGKTQEMVMNGEAWEILKLCNGERIVEQIKEDFATRYSYMNPTADFLKDVVVTLFAFDKGQGLSEHSAPFDAMVQIIDGEAEITLNGEPNIVSKGEMIIMPANVPHALQAVNEPYKMILTMIKSD